MLGPEVTYTHFKASRSQKKCFLLLTFALNPLCSLLRSFQLHLDQLIGLSLCDECMASSSYDGFSDHYFNTFK